MGSNIVTDLNRLSIIRPDLAIEWNIKNEEHPEGVAVNCRKLVWWKCNKCGFEWQARIADRNRYKPTSKNGRTRVIKTPSFCPYCVSDIVKNKKLMKEWNYNKNKYSPVLYGHSLNKVWWKCSKCNYEWETWITNRIKGYGGDCPKCNSILQFPMIAKEYSKLNPKPPELINYGSSKKAIWECKLCKNVWESAVSSRTIGGNGCPKCSKIKLSDGTYWDSKAEAYYYLQLKKEGKKFTSNKRYGKGLGQCRYDFYLPDENKYIEVTSFHRGSIGVNYIAYLRNIVRKKNMLKTY